MSKSIKVSPKHGLNPCMSRCFWCGELKQEIILAGRMKGDAEAPAGGMIVDYEPCEKCAERMATGITIIEAMPTVKFQRKFPDRNYPEIQEGVTPTGRMCVVTEDCVMRMLKDAEMLDSILEQRILLMEDEAYQSIFAQPKEAGEEE